MAFADIRYWVRAHAARTLRSCTLLAVAGILTLAFPQITRGQDIRTQEILFDDNAATTATRHTLTLRGPLDDSLTIDYSLLLPSQSGIGVGALLFVDSWGANTGTTRWLTSTPNAVLTTDASGNPVWGTVSSLITSAGEFADADTIGLDGFVYARQALENGTPDTVVVTDGGAFGIGTTTPDGWITVQGNNDLFRAKDVSGALKSVLTDEGEQNWYLGNPAGDFGQGRVGTILSYPAFSLLRPGSIDQFNILNRSSYTAIGYSADGSDTGSVLSIAQGGNVGVGLATPQNRLHVTATADPLRLEGLQQRGRMDSVLVVDAQGVVYWTPADSLILSTLDSLFIGEGWLLEGNSGTDPAVNFLGTLDSTDLVFRTDNLEAGRFTAGGDLGIGTNAPQNRLHVSATSDPLRLEGLQQTVGLDSVLVVDAQGVVSWAPADSLIRYWIDSAFVGTPAWLLEGNSGTDAAVNFLGTIDSVDLVLRTNSVEAGRITADGNVGLGTAAPQNQLHVSSTTDPLRLDGVQQVFGLDSVMVLDAQGVVHWAPADSLIRYWIDSAVTTPNAWLLDGNAGTDPTINYVGTSDLQDLSIRANAVEHIGLDAATGETNIMNAPAAPGSWNTLNTTLDMTAGGSLNGGGVSNNSLLLGGGGSAGSVNVISANVNAQASGTFGDVYGVRTNLAFPGGALPSSFSSFTGSSVNLTNGGALESIAGFYGYRVEMTGDPAIVDGWGLHLASPGTRTVDFTGIEVEDLGNASGTTRAFFYDGTGGNAPVVVTGAGQVGVGTAAPSQAVEIFDGNLLLSNSATAGQIRFAEPSASGANYSSFEARAQLGDINYILPDTAGASGDILTVQSIAGNTVTLDWGAGVPPPIEAWLLEGNSGTTAGTNFLGTIDNQPMEIKVNSERVMRYVPSSVSPSILGGYSGNTIAAGEDGNVIGGGGAAGLVNEIGTGVDFSVVAGGRDNEVLSSSQLALVGGGEQNSVNTSSNYSLVVGGFDNEVTDTTTYASILGGRNNTLTAGATSSAIVGGRGLTLQGRGSLGFLGGNSGSNNMAIADSNIVLLGNADLWLTNNDSSASAARFYEPNSTTGSFPTTVNFTSLKAQAQAANIEYVFPDTAGIVGDVLAVRSISGTEVVLDWRQSNEIEGVGRLLFARKTSDETVAAGATPALQNDDELYLPLSTNRTYEISGALYIKRSSGVGSFDIGFDVPANSIMLISFFANESKSGNSNTGADIRDVDATGALANSTNYKLVGINTNWNVIHFKGLVVTGNTSGNVTVMWSPDGGTATVYTNSYIGAKVAEN